MVVSLKHTDKEPKYTKRNIEGWLVYLGISKQDKFEEKCICGCNMEIIPKVYHFCGKDRYRKIKYIRGHNTKGRKMCYSKEGLKAKREAGIKLKEWNRKNPHVLKSNWEKTVRTWKGQSHPRWLGGKSFEPYGMGFSKMLKRYIRNRDNNVCQICHIQQTEINLSVHHIDYNKSNNSEFNLISLCIPCHVKTNCNREMYQDRLSYLIRVKYMYDILSTIKTGVLMT